MLTDNGAGVTKRWQYEAFGSHRFPPTGSGTSDFQYAGEQRDPETGLINLRARYYDPALGRFLSRDVVSGRAGFPQSYNRYAYALKNPIRKVDPSGYESVDAVDREGLQQPPGDQRHGQAILTAYALREPLETMVHWEGW